MTDKEYASYILDSLKKKGAEKSVCSLVHKTMHELAIEHGEVKLLRTTTDDSIGLSAIVDNKKGSSAINKKDKDSIDSTVEQVIGAARSSMPDEAYDIAEFQEPSHFVKGSTEPDLDLMFKRLSSFLEYCKEHYPITILEEGSLSFYRSDSIIMNSNGVAFSGQRGVYSFNIMFTSKENDRASSFNTTGFSTLDLDKELIDYDMVKRLLDQSQKQVHSRELEEKFTGDVIITPRCLAGFIGNISGYLGNYSLITGTSMYKDKLNQAIADSSFTLHSMPLSDEIASGYYVTGDAYAAQNSTIIDKGVLKSFILSLYGSRKTGLQRAVNDGGAFMVDPGTKSLDDMIKGIKKGVLLGRFSGGHPAENGDFSGVAKNSFYIEDGKIAYPLQETMISGNLADMLFNIKDISSERVNNGYSILPWMQVGDIVVSCK